MINVTALKKYAEEKLDLAIKYDRLDDYILGFPIYGVRVKNEEGKDEDCVYAKMEAIYKYYSTNPNSLIDQKIYNILLNYSSVVKGSEVFLNILKTIEYQIVAEKENRAPFSMNNQLLLENLKKNLIENKELYLSERYQQIGFWNKIQEHDASLSSNYGHKIL